MKAVTELNWGFTTETLVATYKAIVRPILDHADSIWFTQVLPSHLFKLEVIQNKALRIATFCHQKAAVSYLRSENRVLPWGRISNCVHSSSILASSHPSYLIVTSPPIDPRPLRVALQPSHHYASPTSGEAYRNRRLTTNFELCVEIFCVPTCFHVRIPKPCLSVCPSVRLTPPTPIVMSPITLWPTSSAVSHIQRIWPWGIWGRHPSRSPSS